MKGVENILPNVRELELFQMPDVRVIGKAITSKCNGEENPIPAFWSKYFDDGWNKVIDSLPRVIPNTMVGWTGNYIAETDSFTYIVGVVTPAGTLVPVGCDYRDLPASTVAKGILNESIDETVIKLRELGYLY